MGRDDSLATSLMFVIAKLFDRLFAKVPKDDTVGIIEKILFKLKELEDAPKSEDQSCKQFIIDYTKVAGVANTDIAAAKNLADELNKSWKKREEILIHKRELEDLANKIVESVSGVLLLDGKLLSEDASLQPWLKLYNDFAEKETSTKEEMSNLMISLCEYRWLDYCSIPKYIGIQVHMANAPKMKTAISIASHKLRQKVYLPDDNEYMLHSLKKGYLKDTRAGKYIVERGTNDGCKIYKRGHFISKDRRRSVYTFALVSPDGEYPFHFISDINDNERKQEIFVNTTFAIKKTFTLQQEERAMSKLKGMLNEEQWKTYLIAGFIEENSKHSGVKYFVRKLRPTLAFSNRWQNKLLAGLCLHPLAYYMSSFAGCLCPTDDVISHLMYIRGDEKGFWKNANHHELTEVEIGVP